MKFYYPLIGIFALFLSLNASASCNHNQLYSSAENCKTLKCVRGNIDALDKKIVRLLGHRLAYVKRAGELKKNKKLVYDPVRENKILEKVGGQAIKEGYPAIIAEEIFKTILFQSTAFEQNFVPVHRKK
jgi:isochorismate pyruvate lyase